jgi:hypothetical protein
VQAESARRLVVPESARAGLRDKAASLGRRPLFVLEPEDSRGVRQLFTSRVTGVASGRFLGVGLYYLGRELYEPAPESKCDLLILLPLLGVGFGFFVPFIIEEIRVEHSFPEATAAYNEDLRQRLQLPR